MGNSILLGLGAFTVILIGALFMIGCAVIYAFGVVFAGSFYRFILICLMPISIYIGYQIAGLFGLVVGLGLSAILYVIQSNELSKIEIREISKENENKINSGNFFEKINEDRYEEEDKYPKYIPIGFLLVFIYSLYRLFLEKN
jgi:hypothetical protein